MTHGRLSNAGQVRRKTPKIDSRKRPSPSPRIRNKINFYNRTVRDKPIGQFSSVKNRRRTQKRR